MSLLVANHKSIGRAYMSSELIGSVVANYTSVASVTLTPGVAVTIGEMMVITIGATQVRGLTPPTGWTLITKVSSFGTSGIMYKVAAAGEPANYTVNFTGGVMSGGAAFFQLTNIDVTDPVGASFGNTSVGVVTSLNMGNFPVTRSGMAIAIIAKSGTGGGWTTDNGFTPVLAAGQHKYAYRQYNYADPVETVTWSGPVAESIGIDLNVFLSRYVI